MDDRDLALRNATYRSFVELGRAPTAAEVAEQTGADLTETVAGWRRLHDQHALVLDTGNDEIRMANPFSAVPTPYRVEAGGRDWYGNCAWDAFGILAALGTDGFIETACRDCGQPISVHVRDARPEEAALVFHCLVPAARWWDDIVFT